MKRDIVTKRHVAIIVFLGLYAAFATGNVLASPCEKVPKPCEEQKMSEVHYKALQTKGWAYYCSGDYPFYYDNDDITGFGNNWSRSPSCFSIIENPLTSTKDASKAEFSITNWCTKKHTVLGIPIHTPTSEDITVTLGCSKVPPDVTPACENPKEIDHDPGCPLTGPAKNYCSGGSIPACIQTYTEKCANGVEYDCTRDEDAGGLVTCLYCP